MKPVLSIFRCQFVSSENRLDGDTFRCAGDVSPIVPDSSIWVPKVRVVRIDAPEKGQPGAEEAKEALEEWLKYAPFTLTCYGRDKYGRLLADADRGGPSLAQRMLDEKLVEPMGLQKAISLVVDVGLAREIAHPARRRR